VVAGQPPTYDEVTDKDLFHQFQDRTLEPRTADGDPVAVTTTMWTAQQIIDYLDYRQKRFLRETGIVVARLGYDGLGQNNSIVQTPQIEAVTLPQNLVDVLRLAFVNYDTTNPVLVDSIIEVPREDFTSLDSGEQDWESTFQPTPPAYTQSITETLKAFLANPPSDIGAIDLTFVAFSAALTGEGIALSVPPEFSQYILYGALEDAFSKEGEAYSPEMAQYFGARWDEGIQLAKAMLSMPASLEPGFA